MWNVAPRQNQKWSHELLNNSSDNNLPQLLVRSSFQTDDQPATFKCAHSRCKTCLFIYNVEKTLWPKRSIEITDHFTCTSTNVVFRITCAYCKNLYIGKRNDKKRLSHLDTFEPVARHFNVPNRSKQLMAVCGLSLHLGSLESCKTLEQNLNRRTLFIQLN